MTTDPFTHPWLSGLFEDAEMGEIWSPARQLDHMRRFEIAWARALGESGAVPAPQAETAARRIAGWAPDIAALREGTAADGLPVPALVGALRDAAGDAADAVHRGATSQDVMDSALALTLRETGALIDGRLARAGAALDRLDDRAGRTEITGRTRMQAALPVALSVRIAAWRAPLARHRTRLSRALDGAAQLQVGGPVGDRRGLGPGHVAAMARALGLPEAGPWHAARDGIVEVGAVLSLICGTGGKIGQDVALMVQQGVEDIVLRGGGTSSAMPHKSNPVAAEALVTMARLAAADQGALGQAMVHEQERSGSAWMIEWIVLPRLALMAGLSVCLVADLADRLDAASGFD